MSRRPLSLTDDLLECSCRSLLGRLPRFTAEQTLLVTASLTAAFAALQMVAATLSHSLSLLGDSGDMAVDAFTYALAYFVERERASDGQLTGRLVLLENATIALSGLTLVVGSVLLLIDAASRLKGAGREDAENEVNADYILGFALVNLAIDGVQVTLFLRGSARDQGRDPLVSESAQASSPLQNHSIDLFEPSDAGLVQPASENLNVCSAFIHVGADTLRTVSELASAALIKGLGWDALEVDAKTSVFVNVTVLASGLVILRSLCAKCWAQASTTSPGLLEMHGEPAVPAE
eukprot:CAMPEP_0117546394 /NCGR_PEP_ID=MMETSP0784-20121206/46584_1 /TAXON_ID=39447 /ORGANISM="" /LENGTH=291 /DNA_ID=CAMNT_0005343263 /DNA_START=29 /DNA_END=904 /DNA_ORIENTATION=+